jgi:hypothetical protein
MQSLRLPFGEAIRFILILAACFFIGFILTTIYRRKFLADFIDDLKASAR